MFGAHPRARAHTGDRRAQRHDAPGACLAGLSLWLLCGLSFRNEGHDPTSIRTLFPFEGCNDGLEIVAVLLSNGRPVRADFIDDRIL